MGLEGVREVLVIDWRATRLLIKLRWRLRNVARRPAWWRRVCAFALFLALLLVFYPLAVSTTTPQPDAATMVWASALTLLLVAAVSGVIARRLGAGTDSRVIDRSVINALNDGYYEVDLKGNIVDFNDALPGLVGYAANEVVGVNYRSFMSAEDAARIFAVFNRVYLSGVPHRSVAWRMQRRPQDVPREMEASVSPCLDGGGQVIGFRGIVRDVTERWRMERELRESEERLRRLSEATLEGVVIQDRGRILDVNETAARMFGGKAADLIGRSTLDFVIPEQRERVLGYILEQRENPYESVGLRTDGSTFPMELIGRTIPYDGEMRRITAVRDISDRKAAEAALRDSEERYRRIFEAATDGLLVFDSEGLLVDFNPAGDHMFGLRQREPGTTTLDELLDQRPASFSTSFLAAVRAGENPHDELLGRRGDGIVFDVDLRGMSYRLADGEACLVVARDITEQKSARRHIDYLAHYDLLTGLPNRALLNDRLGQALVQAGRRQSMVGVLFIDLDRFKTVNDSLGHGVGDTLLEKVAQRLRDTVRAGDTVSRSGGDEFVVMLPDLREVREASAVAQKIMEAINRPFEVEAQELRVTPSIGISLYPRDGDALEPLLRNADAAMYHAKERGRANFQFYSDRMHATVRERLAMEVGLRGALEKNQLELVYQPQASMDDFSIIGIEALLRWRHPELGLVYPSRFVEAAEHSGLMAAIGEWVLERACRQNRRWQDAGLPCVPIAVNLSPMQFRRGRLDEVVAGVLERTGLEGRWLELELTETVIMQELASTSEDMRRLKQLGLSLALDDFGKGYSSLSYLKRFPLDKLKIDQSFVRDVVVDPDDAAIVAAIVSMARSLRLGVVAEGVERKEQLEFLREQGCEAVQGFYLQRPVAAATMARILRRGGVQPGRRRRVAARTE